jgi:hypothetical protein
MDNEHNTVVGEYHRLLKVLLCTILVNYPACVCITKMCENIVLFHYSLPSKYCTVIFILSHEADSHRGCRPMSRAIDSRVKPIKIAGRVHTDGIRQHCQNQTTLDSLACRPRSVRVLLVILMDLIRLATAVVGSRCTSTTVDSCRQNNIDGC